MRTLQLHTFDSPTTSQPFSISAAFKMAPIDATVHFVRHGETDANKNGIIQGQAGGDFPLNATGRMQAKKTGERLCAEAFTAVYVSDATRTLDTARAIVQENQVFNDFSKAKIWPLLRERSFGKLEGMPVEDFIAQAETDGHSIFWDYTPEGGEDLEQVRLRAKKFFEEFLGDISSSLGNADSPPHVLVVTHGRFLKELMSHLHDDLGMVLPEGTKPLEFHFPGNTAVCKIHFTLGGQIPYEGLRCSLLYCGEHVLEANKALRERDEAASAERAKYKAD